ncbi:hypothetical protein SDJN03_08480, partial [Cucurbita argyrosperma subsp. sororia]
MPKNLSKLKRHTAAATAAAKGRNPNHGSDSSNSSRCRKHPKHKQSPGVCSLCLREKLSNLTITKPVMAAETAASVSSSSLSSLSSYYSSSFPSSSASPYFPRTKSSISSLFKRRSTPTQATNPGFWSKLMMNRRPKQLVSTSSLRSNQFPNPR